MYPISNILDLWWPPASLTQPGGKHLHGRPFGSWKRSRDRSTPISIDTKIRLFNTTRVWMTLGYYQSTWKTRYMPLPHPVTGSCWASNALIVWKITQIYDIGLHPASHQQRQLLFLRHILRMPEDEQTVCSR